MSTATRVGVVIVNYNSGPWLERCLLALTEQSRAPDRVVVVDNASEDQSWPVDANINLPVELVQLDHNVGFAKANNLAVDRLDDVEWIVTLNPDAIASRSWLEDMLVASEKKSEFDFFGCRMVAEDRAVLDGVGDIYHSSGLVWRHGHGDPVSAHPVANPMAGNEIFSACAAAALYRRQCWLEAGGLDERFFCYVEDVDLGFRLRLLGYRCWYVPTAEVMHVGSAVSGSHSDFTIYHGHRNLVWTYVKNMPNVLFWLYLPQHLALNIATIAGFIVRGQSRPVWRAKRDALKRIPEFWRDRRRIQRRRRASTQQIRGALTHGLRPFFNRRYRYQRP